jgi:hypothetical protein
VRLSVSAMSGKFSTSELKLFLKMLYNIGRLTYTPKNKAVYRVLKKGLQALRGYSAHLNEQSSSQHMSRNQCLLRYGRVNLWLGIIGVQILRPVILPNRLAGVVYHSFLVNYLPVFLEHVPLHQRQRM